MGSLLSVPVPSPFPGPVLFIPAQVHLAQPCFPIRRLRGQHPLSCQWVPGRFLNGVGREGCMEKQPRVGHFQLAFCASQTPEVHPLRQADPPRGSVSDWLLQRDSFLSPKPPWTNVFIKDMTNELMGDNRNLPKKVFEDIENSSLNFVTIQQTASVCSMASISLFTRCSCRQTSALAPRFE